MNGNDLICAMALNRPIRPLDKSDMIKLRKAVNRGLAATVETAFEPGRSYALAPEVEQIGFDLFAPGKIGKWVDGAFVLRDNAFVRDLGANLADAILASETLTITLVDYDNFGTYHNYNLPVFEVVLASGRRFRYVNGPWQSGFRFMLNP